MKSKQLLMVLLSATALVMVFQNCSDVNFQSVGDDGILSKMDSNPDGLVVTPIRTSGPSDPGDQTTSTTQTPSAPGDGQIEFECSETAIQDIIVNIENVTLDGQVAETLTGSQSLLSLSHGMDIKLNSSIRASALRINLLASGNTLIDVQDQAFALKTPSAVQSGLKVTFSGSTGLIAGKTYRVAFEFDTDSQVVQNPDKCILKPHFKLTSIQEKTGEPEDPVVVD